MGKRLFIAVDLSDEARRAAQQFIEGLRHRISSEIVRFEPAEKLHFTLKFLGNTDESKIANIHHTCALVAGEFELFNVKLDTVCCFPERGKPRVLWLGVSTGGGILAEIASRLDAHLGGKNKGKFIPHCTIGRVRRTAKNSHDVRDAISDAAFAPVSWMTREIVLYESVLLPSGSRYERLASFPLLSG